MSYQKLFISDKKYEKYKGIMVKLGSGIFICTIFRIIQGFGCKKGG